MANYGNMPYALGHYYKKRRRRRRVAGGLAVGAGLAGLFGSRRGRKLIGAGLRRLPTGMRSGASRALKPVLSRGVQYGGVARRAVKQSLFKAATSSWASKLANTSMGRSAIPWLAKLVI